MEIVLALAIVVLVAYVVSGPLRSRDQPTAEDPNEAELAELEARKRAKYREIRDAEGDHATGKLSDQDFGRLDAELRAEAVAILKRMDRLREKPRTDLD